ncbi:matrixin family metalloprotease [Sinosporangium siamense]|uniref:Peptidase metallopeptidase domain-containing protein n=1 Tax=Sinosporangium siamense TaxID=1367973 RepID=A0A919RJE3_9ACTN|nr:matrixin family metalloprotease [Sinosporangium siamense]GII93449.1 hypothetical protein Ssi02_36800 [Sinosporangium siamense]
MSVSAPGSTPSVALRKGDEGREVQRLYLYLKRFGYFPNEAIRIGNLLFSPVVPFEPEVTSRYDDHMELAVTRFQEQQGLEVTGAVNDETLALMQRPRCGFPDQAVSGLAAYVVQGNRWPNTTVTYSYSNSTPDLSLADQRGALKGAFDRWAAVTPLTFREVASEGDIRIGWYSGDHGDGAAFDGPHGVLAHCFYPPPNGGALAGDCHFDEAENWSINLPPNGIDLPTVALHEIGHGLGLAHSADPSAVMYAYYGGPRRELAADDIAGIRSVYGRRLGWSSLGGIVFQPTVISNADGRLEVFVYGSGNALHHKWQTSVGGSWSNWASLGGWVRDPVATVNADGRLEVFVRGSDNALHHRWQTSAGGSWSNWASLGGWIRDPAAIANADGRLEVFARGSDNALHHKWQTSAGGPWSNWSSLGGAVNGTIAVARNRDGRLEVFVNGDGNVLQHRWQTTAGGLWSGWSSLGGRGTDPAVAVNADGRLEVFVRGSDNALHHRWQTTPGGSWSNWSSLGGWIKDPTTIANADGRLEVFARGIDNKIYHIWQISPGGSWSTWALVGGLTEEAPTIGRNRDGRLEVFVRGSDSALHHIWQTAPNNGWV